MKKSELRQIIREELHLIESAKKIKNPTAKIWKKGQLQYTVKNAKEAGYKIIKDGDTTEIINPDDGDIVLRSIRNGNSEIVRFDKSYF